MNKKTNKRLLLNRQTLRNLQLAEVHGGGNITKPNGSCFIVCVVTATCGPTARCLATAFC